ncbi:MAG: hypothetical protein CMJ78_11485 [Planctomycetaceae bacterium]|nr:hypothetical protein [Planctomycetaceae bacterium]
MASVAAQSEVPKLKQNWVLSPLGDFSLIIAAPAISLVWAAWFFLQFGPESVLAIFFVFNVAHHCPTFIRIYGDKDVLKRFRWSLILGPIFPFGLSLLTAAYLIQSGLGVDKLMFLFVILTIWDPWHFLMQHYGFMRIYDRHNQAPRKLSSRMDLTLCWLWFGYIMIAAIDWLPDLLYKLQMAHGIPLLELFQALPYQFLETSLLIAASAATLAYLGYLSWCRANGFYISWAKLALVVITFGIMYITYVPNDTVNRFLPGWNFTMGFATVGMVHVTQYLAIVWKYNRGLTNREGKARVGIFYSAFARGGFLIATLYVVFCLLYGYILSADGQRVYVLPLAGVIGNDLTQWVAAVMVSLAFTSNFLHYYYDGFIWKVRHKENQQNLAMTEGGEEPRSTQSWWDRNIQSTAMETLARQALYFGLPIGVLALSFWYIADTTITQPQVDFQVARQLASQGRTAQSQQHAAAIITSIDEQLEVETSMLKVRKRAQHHLKIAALIELRLQIDAEFLSAVDTANAEERKAQKLELIQKAINSYLTALELPGPYMVGPTEVKRADIEHSVADLHEKMRES